MHGGGKRKEGIKEISAQGKKDKKEEKLRTIERKGKKRKGNLREINK